MGYTKFSLKPSNFKLGIKMFGGTPIYIANVTYAQQNFQIFLDPLKFCDSVDSNYGLQLCANF